MAKTTKKRKPKRRSKPQPLHLYFGADTWDFNYTTVAHIEPHFRRQAPGDEFRLFTICGKLISRAVPRIDRAEIAFYPDGKPLKEWSDDAHSVCDAPLLMSDFPRVFA